MYHPEFTPCNIARFGPIDSHGFKTRYLGKRRSHTAIPHPSSILSSLGLLHWRGRIAILATDYPQGFVFSIVEARVKRVI